MSPPIIAGYVGTDHAAAIFASRLHTQTKPTCLVDIGTNTEISLHVQGKIYSCSCASGPAFEGAHIQHGIRAVPGAIETVKITNQTIQLSTIGQIPPIGLCGSGILSAVAELRRNEIIDYRGTFIKNHPLVKITRSDKYVVLANIIVNDHNTSLTINRADIHEIQLAKGAIRTGIEILCHIAGISPRQIESFLIAGAFGNHLDLESAIEIGMFPDIPIQQYQQIGNAAGVGAREFLIVQSFRSQAETLVEQIEYVELTTEPTFNDVYVLSLFLEKNADIFEKI